MPDMHLTKDEMQDIIAYLDTLRTLEGAPPPFCRLQAAKSPNGLIQLNHSEATQGAAIKSN